MTENKITVLVVEDTPVMQMLLAHLINSDPHLRVIGTASNGEEAVNFLAEHKPDVVLMDIHMPKMDGYEATRRIMESEPLPIVISSASMHSEEVNLTFQALEAGAVAFVEKPVGPGHPNFTEMVHKLVQTLRLMAEVRVVKRWPRARIAAAGRSTLAPEAALMRRDIEFIGLGASTGGPPVLQTILAGLPQPFGVPVLIVQHIATGFLDGLVHWLRQSTGWHVDLAVHGATPQPGWAYLAPDGFHLGVMPGGRLRLSKEPPENGLRPAVSYLFRSLAQHCGARAVGVLLTGMGRDGAEELKLLKNRGALTIAQDAESAIVHGMPGEAIRLGAATHVLPPERIAATLAVLATGR